MKDIRIDWMTRSVSMNPYHPALLDYITQRGSRMDGDGLMALPIYEGEMVETHYVSTYEHMKELREQYLFTFPEPQNLTALFGQLSKLKQKYEKR